ncbi:hypothetical protein Q2T42_18200 [Leptolyngbya boryana CZ1]|uniref:Uncharacterized protein n=1 Tax=Leptolyngbya boryana CZ1 TaxID=3060204 RepID=A0AA96WPT6_LEPBY|nr:hypothetical protein [Leptolyngbya boryana]WNZ43776.1 hypothetical protein Q2T42_18200 [Leptolyngbya boryana CZ1]
MSQDKKDQKPQDQQNVSVNPQPQGELSDADLESIAGGAVAKTSVRQIDTIKCAIIAR